MSYKEFVKAVSIKCPDWKRTENTDMFFDEVRDEWIQEDKINELIKFVLEDYDTTCSDPYEFISPIRKHLIKHKNFEQLKTLYEGLIKVRTHDLWFYLPQLKNKSGILTKKHLDERNEIVKEAQTGALKYINCYIDDMKQIPNAIEENKMIKLRKYVKDLVRPRPKIL